jgi:transposase-like protein
MKWKELSGEERYRVVELARKGGVEVAELCRTFGVSRQTLYKAMSVSDRASVEALEPKPGGRKKPAVSEHQVRELEKTTSTLQKELDRWKTKYEVATAFLDLERKLERGEPLPGENPGEKKRRKQKKR